VAAADGAHCSKRRCAVSTIAEILEAQSLRETRASGPGDTDDEYIVK